MEKTTSLKKQLENKTFLIWKLAIASALSWEIAKLAGSKHPYLAPLSVILCMQTTVNRSLQFSYHRLVGTVIGIAATVLASPHLKVNGWTIGLLILISCFIAKWLKRDETVLHQVALTVLLVFVFAHKSDTYFSDRFRDTLIGAIVTVALHMLVYPPNFTKQTAKRLAALTNHFTSTILKVSAWIESGLEKEEGCSLQIEINTLQQELQQIKEMLTAAMDSLKYNPFGKKSEKELRKYEQKYDYIQQGHTYLSSIVGTFMDWSNAGTITAEQQKTWSNQLQAFAPVFGGEVQPTELATPKGILQVTIPKELEKQQYHVTLCQETTQFIKKLTDK